VVLSQSEVFDILGHVRFRHHQVCLTTIYSLGLRIGEGTHPEKDRDRLCTFRTSIRTVCLSISIAERVTRTGMCHYRKVPWIFCGVSGKHTEIRS
jgi:hypothetical protein